MKVILVNGSSRKGGCTGVALNEVARGLRDNGIETEHFFIGNAALPDCIACRKCRELGRCVFQDLVNDFVERARQAGRLCVRLSGVLRPPQRPPADADGPGILFRWFRLCLQARGGRCSAPGGRGPPLPLMSSTSISPSRPCRWCPPTTGTMSTGMSRRR